MQSLLGAIEGRFGARLKGASVGRMESFAELAVAVQLAVAGTSDTPG
jgi:hypothetical protein